LPFKCNLQRYTKDDLGLGGGGVTAVTPLNRQLADPWAEDESTKPPPMPMSARVAPLDPVSRAAAAAAAAGEQAARREMLESIERSKAEILEKMEKTDAAIASLERDIAVGRCTLESS
jgi:hypothetical protein